LQEWAQELPEGSYRYPSRWLEERGSWLKNGMPMRADLKATLSFALFVDAALIMHNDVVVSQ
jgi:hypothetical protein